MRVLLVPMVAVMALCAVAVRGAAPDRAAEIESQLKRNAFTDAEASLAAWKSEAPDDSDYFVCAANLVLRRSAPPLSVTPLKEGNYELTTDGSADGKSARGVAIRDPKTSEIVGRIGPGEPDDTALSQALTLLRQGGAKAPQRLDIAFGIAHLCWQLGDYGSQVDAITSGVEFAVRHPAKVRWVRGGKLPDPPDEFMARTLHKYVGELLERDAPTGYAVKVAELAARSFPKQPYAFNDLAGLSDMRGEESKVLGYLEQAHAAAPKDALVIRNLAYLHKRDGNKEKARKYYGMLLNLKGADPELVSEARDELKALK